MSSVVSLNAGAVRRYESAGRRYTSAIVKTPVDGRLAVRGVNVDGDDQADRNAHGGPERALYAYAAEDTAWWEEELGRALGPGFFGENLTTHGLNVSGTRVGERWRIGTVILEVAGPRVPCFKLAARVGDPAFVKRFADALRPGAYLRIVEPGELGAGDAIERIAPAPEPSLAMAEFARIFFHARERAGELLAVPALGENWRGWAHDQTASRH